jgi:hypothetical protein
MDGLLSFKKFFQEHYLMDMNPIFLKIVICRCNVMFYLVLFYELVLSVLDVLSSWYLYLFVLDLIYS